MKEGIPEPAGREDTGREDGEEACVINSEEIGLHVWVDHYQRCTLRRKTNDPMDTLARLKGYAACFYR